MEYDRLKKEELIKELEKRDISLKGFEKIQREFENNKKLKDDLLAKEYSLKKELDAEKKKSSQLDLQNKALTTQLNALADLFNEGNQALKDTITTLDLFMRTIRNNHDLLEVKINRFNQKGDESK